MKWFFLICLTALLACSKQNKESLSDSNANVYIVNRDTVAIFISEEYGMVCNVWTKNRLRSSDLDLIKSISNKFNINDDKSIFFYLDSSLINDNSYYAHYTMGILKEKRQSNEQENKDFIKRDIKETIEYCKSNIKIETLNEAIVFLSKVDYLDEKMKKYADDRNLSNAIKTFKNKNFPIARKAYCDNAKNKLSQKNISVKLENKNIIFVGYMFANKSVVDATFKEISDEIKKFRFNRVSFQWYEGSDITYYDLKTKDDSDM